MILLFFVWECALALNPIQQGLKRTGKQRSQSHAVALALNPIQQGLKHEVPPTKTPDA